MKRYVIVLTVLCCAVCLPQAYTETPEEIGTRLMKRNDDRPVFERVKNKVVINIYNTAGELKFKKSLIMGAYTENMGTPNQCEKYISYFMAPPDDMGNSYLALNYKNKPDEKYLYLKGIRKVKKVTGADKKLSFFGSDFANGDVGKPDFLEWKYRLIGEDKIEFKGKIFDCNMIECLPRDEGIKRDTGYSKRIFFLEKKTGLTLKIDYYDEAGIKCKQLRLLSFTTAPNVRGEKVFYETGIEMKNVKTGSRTELLFIEPKFEAEANIRTDIFTTEYLTRRWW